uniref:SRCR domain-containing protein n=1 Tax=Macrostomum lignano TaxID=282301 RepID=A0A1I8HH59_9PLAT
PLLPGIPGQLEVAVSASSSNYRRGPETALLGAALNYEDHLKCTVVGGDSNFYDYGVTMTASGRACVPWTGSNSAFNRSCITLSAGKTTRCQVNSTGGTENCHNSMEDFLCSPLYSPSSDRYARKVYSAAYQKTFYFNDALISNPSQSSESANLNTDGIASDTPQHYWRLLVDLKSSHCIGFLYLDLSRSINNFSIKVGNEWNSSLKDLAFESWPECYKLNVAFSSSSYYSKKIKCASQLCGRYVVLLQGVAAGKLGIRHLRLQAEE